MNVIEYTLTDSVWATYDGQSHTVSVTVTEPESGSEVYYTIDGGTTWKKGSEYSLTDVGEATVSFKIENGTTTVTTENRTIEIDQRSITITTESDKKTYDGEELLAGESQLSEGTVVAGEELKVEVTGAITNVGNVENEATVQVIRKSDGEDVTGNYAVTVVPGTLTVEKRKVTLTSDTKEKIWDGTALTAENVTVGGKDFVTGEGADYKVTGTQTDVGSSENTFTYTLHDDTDEKNYDITVVPGTLTVNAAAPDVAILTENEWFNKQQVTYTEAGVQQVTLWGTVADHSGEGIKEVVVDGHTATITAGTINVSTWSVTFEQKETSGREITAVATDERGIQSVSGTYILNVDTIKPDIVEEGVFGAGGTTTKYVDEETGKIWFKQNGGTATLAATITDENSGLGKAEYYGKYDTDNKVFILDLLNEGDFSSTIKAWDKAGNQSESTTVRSYYVDGTAPTIGACIFDGDSKYEDAKGGVWFQKGDKTAVLKAEITDLRSGLYGATYAGIMYASGTFSGLDTTEEKEYSAAIIAEDNVGNKSNSDKDKRTYNVDGTGPEVSDVKIEKSYSGEADKFWIKKGSEAVVSVTVTDAKSGVGEVSFHGSTMTAKGNNIYSIDYDDAENEHTQYAYAIIGTDNVGNSSEKTIYVGVDGTGPEISNVAVSNSYSAETDKYWIKKGATSVVRGTVTDAKSGVGSVTFKGTTVTGISGTYSTAYDTADENEQCAYAIIGTDNVGNSSEKTIYVGVDGTGPEISNVAVSNSYSTETDKYWIKRGVESIVSATVTDAKSGVKEVAFNGLIVTATSSTYHTVYDTATEHEQIAYKIIGTDNVGNSNAPRTLQIGVDGTGPVIGEATISGDNVYQNWIKTGVAFSVSTKITDAKSGFATALLEGVQYADGKFDLTAGEESDLDDHVITAVDNVGNENTLAVQYGFDGTGPVIGKTTISGDNIYKKWIKSGTAFTVSTEITDAKSGFKEATLEGVQYADGKFDLTAGGDAELAAHIITANDNVGNQNTATVEYGFDGTGPEISNVAVSNSYSTETDKYWIKRGVESIVSATVTDAKSGVKEVSFDGSIVTGVSGAYRTDYNTSAEHELSTYTIRCTDNVGNESTEKIQIGVDGTGPVIGEGTISGSNVYGKWIKSSTAFSVQTEIIDPMSGLKEATLEGVQYADGKFDLTAGEDAELADHIITAVDNLGNQSTSAIQYGFDGTGPEISDVAVSNSYSAETDKYWIKKGATSVVSGTVTDAKSGVEKVTFNGVTVSGAESRYIAAYDTTAEHEQYLYVIAGIDNVGNDSTKTIKVGVDGTGPVIGETTISGNNVYENWIKSGTEFTVSTEIKDVMSGLQEATLDGASYANGNFKLIAGMDAAIADHVITAVDNVGNENTLAVQYGFDGIGPEFQIGSFNGYVDNRGNVWFQKDDGAATLTIGITDAKSGVKEADYLGVQYADGKFSGLNTATEGYFNSVIYAQDNVGNASHSSVYGYNVDGTGPTITISQDSSLDPTFFSVVVTVNVEDYGSGVSYFHYQVDGGAWQEYDAGKGIIVNKICTVTVEAFDNVGNQSSAKLYVNKVVNPVIDGYATTVHSDCNEDSIAVKNGGVLKVESGVNCTVKTLCLESGTVANVGNVLIGNLVLRNDDNALGGNAMAIGAVQFDENAGLSLNKTQYDKLMASTTFSGTGTLKVQSVDGEVIRQSDIETLIKKANVNNVQFQQDLIGLYNLKVAAGKNLTVSFYDVYGTTKSDKIRFLKNSTATFGSEGRIINLEKGKNEIRMDSGAQVTIKSDLANVSVVKAEKNSKEQATRVVLANVDFAGDRAATLGIGNYGTMDVGNVTGSVKSDQITTGTGSTFEAGNISMDAGNDKITTGTGSAFDAGNISMGAGNDKITTGKESKFFADSLQFGDGNDKITTGKNSTFSADSISGVETIQLGAYSKTTIAGSIEGTKKLTISNGKEGQIATLKASAVTGTAANDSFSLGNWNDVDFASLDLGDGNDTLSIGKGASLSWEDGNVDLINFGEGKNTLSGTTNSVLSAGKILFGAGNDKVNFTGKNSSFTAAALDLGDGNDTLNFGSNMFAEIADLDFGGGKDTLKIGKGSTVALNVKELTSDTLKLSIGRDSTLYFSTNLREYAEQYFAPGYFEDRNITIKDYSALAANR